MTQHPATGTLEQAAAADPSPDPGAAAAEARPEPLVRPADLVSALTGVALCFFSLFVFAVTHWQYFGPDVDDASILGWLAPLVAGVVCLLASVVSVAVRVSGRRAERA
ncbi:hypothetical protein [Rathayibacter tanaceti]|uniref:Uncharacterized protein n=2 Tax=Rathayibacter tanaceti TaxID=1671680 RepID=A0A166HPE9_9MICO|nr:hypothetical protein [Rathayibacter tanaceti]KZX20945.1 hypothetical protein ACH61_01931 [Rathayibacter tanaceti]QHC56093.1 hypothetical protein GSU10_10935 [Rathayibacter tanaceti]TCO36928.1 hypothetical protein EV639_10511 [Rathayibacter tanaceti]